MKVLTTSTNTAGSKPDYRIPLKGNMPLWWIKLTHWEFWPFNVFYFPIYLYALWLMLKTRSPFFFSASNPGIDYGGMLGESKIKIFNLIPDRYKPKTVLIDENISLTRFNQELIKSGVEYPFILKPDIGERGWMVKKINNEAQLNDYLNEIKVPFLLQELVDWPIEMGVFYVRHPKDDNGRVTSIVLKEMLTVMGDGKMNVEQLLQQNARSAITLNEIRKTSGDIFTYVPENGESVEVVPIGNHCRGTTFLNGNHLINDTLQKVFDDAAKTYPEFYFGRFDIRCQSIKELEKGNFSILELNGCGAEPGHIYHPGFSLFKAYGVLIDHLNLMYQIAKENNRKGVNYMSIKEGIALIRFIRNYNRLKK